MKTVYLVTDSNQEPYSQSQVVCEDEEGAERLKSDWLEQELVRIYEDYEIDIPLGDHEDVLAQDWSYRVSIDPIPMFQTGD